MNLLNYCKTVKGEIEVWDKDIYVSIPYYNYDGDFCFEDSEENHYLHLMEKWFLSLEAETMSQGVCSVNCYEVIERDWEEILFYYKNAGLYDDLVRGYDGDRDPDLICDFVEDIFTSLSQGYYRFAMAFCCAMKLEERFQDEIVSRYYNNKINTVIIEKYPENISFFELGELRSDLSQGTGNVVKRFFYIPALDIICIYVDF